MTIPPERVPQVHYEDIMKLPLHTCRECIHLQDKDCDVYRREPAPDRPCRCVWFEEDKPCPTT
jgi:hypothetical protein